MADVHRRVVVRLGAENVNDVHAGITAVGEHFALGDIITLHAAFIAAEEGGDGVARFGGFSLGLLENGGAEVFLRAAGAGQNDLCLVLGGSLGGIGIDALVLVRGGGDERIENVYAVVAVGVLGVIGVDLIVGISKGRVHIVRVAAGDQLLGHVGADGLFAVAGAEVGREKLVERSEANRFAVGTVAFDGSVDLGSLVLGEGVALGDGLGINSGELREIGLGALLEVVIPGAAVGVKRAGLVLQALGGIDQAAEILAVGLIEVHIRLLVLVVHAGDGVVRIADGERRRNVIEEARVDKDHQRDHQNDNNADKDKFIAGLAVFLFFLQASFFPGVQVHFSHVLLPFRGVSDLLYTMVRRHSSLFYHPPAQRVERVRPDAALTQKALRAAVLVFEMIAHGEDVLPRCGEKRRVFRARGEIRDILAHPAVHRPEIELADTVVGGNILR